MKKLTAYTWVFIFAILTFFTVGMFTLGSVKTTGKSMTVLQETTVYYEFEKNETIDGIYLNVGAIHAEVGTEAVITVKTSNSDASAAPTSASWSIVGEPIRICNVSDGKNENSKLYNWINVASGLSRSA